MEYLGIPVPLRDPPPLDGGFLPLRRWQQSFLASARQPFALALEGPGGAAVLRTRIHGAAEHREADVFHVARLAKALLWTYGGHRLLLRGSEAVCRAVAEDFSPAGERRFDAAFMAQVYNRPLSVERTDVLPPARQAAAAPCGGLEGCRIGFDAGGTDRKVTALVDGKAVFSRETPWAPKEAADPRYHYEGVTDDLRAAAAHLPRVDAVGVSSAGVVLESRVLVSSLFRGVPPERYDRVPELYRRAVEDLFGPIPFAAANDGDVSALAGAMALGRRELLGLAMGTSEAAGYVDAAGAIPPRLNELAFVPIAAGADAPRDEWSGDAGCGAQYLSQEAVLRLAREAGLPLPPATSGEQLRAVQTLAEQGEARALAVFDTVGVYLAHALALYRSLFPFRHALLLGRVTSGTGGERILRRCRRTLRLEYPGVSRSVRLLLPDETFRRLGQSAAAAALPRLPEG